MAVPPELVGYSASRLRVQQVPEAEVAGRWSLVAGLVKRPNTKQLRRVINEFYVICKIIVLAYPGAVGHTGFVLPSLVRPVVVVHEVICPPCG